jgi:hypothetical protein
MNADLYKAAMLKLCLRDALAPATAPPTVGAALNGSSSKEFRLLDDAEQAAFCERLTVEVFAPREEIVIQGQQHNQNFFIITQGSGLSLSTAFRLTFAYCLCCVVLCWYSGFGGAPRACE